MKYKKKILILGGYGFLGNALFNRICSDIKYCNNYDVFRTSRRDGIDLRNLKDAVYLIGKQKPDIIINCAAITNIEKTENDTQKLFLVNVIGKKSKLTLKNELKFKAHFSKLFLKLC